MKHLLLMNALFVAMLAHAQSDLSVDVLLSKPNAGGVVRVAICPDAVAYDSEKGCILREAPANGASVRVRFTGLAPGTYGLKVFHDVNSNGKLDTSWMGIPNEPYGFGNDARGRFGPPPFQEAAVAIGTVPGVTAVKLK